MREFVKKVKQFFKTTFKAICSFVKGCFKFLKSHPLFTAIICFALFFIAFIVYVWIVKKKFPLFYPLSGTQFAIIFTGLLIFFSIAILVGFILRLTKRQEKMNNELLSQNKEIATSYLKSSIMPYIALTNVSIKRNYKPPMASRPMFVGTLDGLKESFEKNKIYNEFKPDEFYFTISQDKVSFSTTEPDYVQEFSQRFFTVGSLQAKHQVKKMCIATAKNVGNGSACNLTCGVFKKGEKKNSYLHKTSQIFSIEKNSDIKITLFVKDLVDDGEYYLYFKYTNIYGDKYLQPYPFKVKDSVIDKICLDSNQIKMK